MATKKKKTVKKSPKKAKVAPKPKPKHGVSKRIGKVGGLGKGGLTVTVNTLKKQNKEHKKAIIALKKRQAKERLAAKEKLAKARKVISAQAKKILRSEAAKKGWRKKEARYVITERLRQAAEDGRMYEEAQDLFIIYDDFYSIGEIYTMGMSP